MATVSQLIADSEQIRDETEPGANTSLRVGTLLKNMAESFGTLGLDPLRKIYQTGQFTCVNLTVSRTFYFDTQLNGVSNAATSFSIHVTGIGMTTIAPATGGPSALAIDEWVSFTQSNTTAFWELKSIQVISPDPASKFPGFTNLSEIKLNPHQSSAGIYAFDIEVNVTGSFPTSAFVSLQFEILNQSGRPDIIVSYV